MSDLVGNPDVRLSDLSEGVPRYAPSRKNSDELETKLVYTVWVILTYLTAMTFALDAFSRPNIR